MFGHTNSVPSTGAPSLDILLKLPQAARVVAAIADNKKCDNLMCLPLLG